MEAKPTAIDVSDQQLSIQWSDGSLQKFTAQYLRQQCQCAHCISETTGELLLDQSKIPENLEFNHAEPVGNYAVSFTFSDGHSTGIYSFEFLRGLTV